MKGDSYKEHLVWQKAVALVDVVYDLTDIFPRKHQYTLGSHIEKSVLSIPSNIAEGKARKYTKDFKRFCYIAIGSCAELDIQLVIANNRKLISDETYKQAEEKIFEIMKMTRGLINSM